MPTQFKMASRSDAERSEHKQKLNEIFSVAGKDGKLNFRGVGELNKNRFEIAETIVELLKDELTVVDPTPFLVEKRSQGFVDKNMFQRLDGTVKVVNRSYGSKPLSQRLTASEFAFSTSMKEVAIELPLEEIVGGRLSASDAVEAMAYAIARYKVSLVLDALDAAVTAVADHTGLSGYNLRYTGFTETNLQRAIDGMRDDAETPTIFARHQAIYPAIRAFATWSPDTKSDFMARGQVGEFLGAPIVTLIDKYSRLLGGHQVAANRVWVAAAQKGAWLIEKDVSFLNYAEVNERTAVFSTGIRLEDGVFVHDAHKYRILTV